MLTSKTSLSPTFPRSFSLGGSFLKAGGSGAEDILTNDDLIPKNKIKDFFPPKHKLYPMRN